MQIIFAITPKNKSDFIYWRY